MCFSNFSFFFCMWEKCPVSKSKEEVEKLKEERERKLQLKRQRREEQEVVGCSFSSSSTLGEPP